MKLSNEKCSLYVSFLAYASLPIGSLRRAVRRRAAGRVCRWVAIGLSNAGVIQFSPFRHEL